MELKVLMHPPPDGPTSSPYVTSLARSLENEGVVVAGLSIQSLLSSRGALVHIHWPEHLFGDSHRFKSPIKLVVGRLLLHLASIRGHAVVWTAHNLEPHNGWPVGVKHAAADFRKQIDALVVLCDGQQREIIAAFPELHGVPARVVPEGRLHAGTRLPSPDFDGRPVRLLHLGAVSPYKAQAEVVEGLTDLLVDGDVELKIVGRVDGTDYAKRLERTVSALAGVELVQQRVSEEVLMTFLEWSDAVIGIQRPAFNTGVAAAALPLGRPVVLSAGTQQDFLSSKLGPDWTWPVSDPRSAEDWRPVVEWVRQRRGDAPSEFFDWATRARQCVKLYEELSDR